MLSSLTAARADDADDFFQRLDKADIARPPSKPVTPPQPRAAERTDGAPFKTPVAASPAPSIADRPKPLNAAADESLTPKNGVFGPFQPLASRDETPEHERSTALARPAASGLDALDPEPDTIAKPTGVGAIDPMAGPPTEDASPAPAKPLEPLPPLNAALKAALDSREAKDPKGAGAAERRKERKAIAFFYAARGFAPLWTKDGKPIDAVGGVTARLGRAGEDGLSGFETTRSLNTQGSLEENVESEIALTEAVVSYARQASGSRVDPQAMSPLIGLHPHLADPAETLESLSEAGETAGDKLQAFNPVEPRYVALRTKLAQLRDARTLPPGAKAVPPGPPLHVGMRDPRVPLLRERFHLEVGLGGKPDALRYDSQVAEAVAAYQRRSGLPPSGALTSETVAALSGTRTSALEGTLVANMEMWRWMPRDLGANRVEVNVPDFLVTVFRDGQPVSQNRVVVGKTDTPTPLFSNAMKYVIVNPYWNVPQSIIKKEMLPKGGGDLSYLEGRGYSVSYHGGQATVKQLPGDKNALGRIKFLFPNDYSVYLHDTPSKALFSASKRAFSHGCVRVDQPFAFAENVLGDAMPDAARGRWSEERLEGMIGDKERYVNLSVPLPIHIEYFTASVDPEKQTVKLRDDVYGYTRAVAAALGQGTSEPVAEVERKPRVVAQRVRRRQPDAFVDDSLDPR